jgi:hypothetical protein
MRRTTARGRASYRSRLKRLARDFYQRHAVWAVRNMAISAVERDWRVQLILGPDTRNLTSRLMGDPVYERSMLFFKRMQAHG